MHHTLQQYSKSSR